MSASSARSEIRTATSEWRTARRLYAVYSGVVAHFDVGLSPCPEIESPLDRRAPSVRERVRDWLNEMDTHCPVTFLRQVLQRDPVGTEANLRALIRRHLDRPNKTDFDRDKLDFLAVQYFAQCVPDGMSPDEPTLVEVGKVLEPVLGHWSPITPHWLRELDELVHDVAKCHCMQDLEDYKVLDRGRDLKATAGARFFEPPALSAFTRYNIILRRAFFYTMRADLDAVRLNVARLEKMGVKAIDATRAGLSDREALASVHRICLEWRSIFRTDYSAGHVFRSIKELLVSTEAALAEAKRRRQEERTRRGASAEHRRAEEAAARENSREAALLGIDLEVHLSAAVSDDELERALSVFEAAPENTVERAYPELTVESDPVAGTPARFKVPEVIARIHPQLAGAEDNTQPSLVRLHKSATQLASWERKAFFAECDEWAASIKSSAAARLILQEAFDDFQDGYTNDLPVALAIAHGEAGRMQEKVAEARDGRNVDCVVAMTATAQRLLALIQETEFAWSQEEE